MDVAIMIEGQNGLNWQRWQRIARATEDLGFPGLYRSDHFTNMSAPDLDSLELWTSLTWLATHTRRLEFGPLVTPFSFRHPTLTVRMAVAVDDLSGGRLTLGLGAGWQEREHTTFGFDLLDLRGRFARMREGMEIVTRLLHGDEPVSFGGVFYRVNGALVLPRPSRPGGPRVLVGGNGVRRTLPMAARYAHEWNATFQTPEKFQALCRRLDRLLERAGRPASAVRRSMMTGVVFGRTDPEVQARLRGRSRETLRARGVIIGTPGEAIEQLREFERAGMQRIMLQWLDLDDLDGLEALARTVLPVFGGDRRGSAS